MSPKIFQWCLIAPGLHGFHNLQNIRIMIFKHNHPKKVLQKFIEILYVDSILINWNNNMYKDHVRPLKFHPEGGYCLDNML